MFSYKILNLPSFPIQIEIIDKIFQKIWEKVNIKQNWELNIVFVTWDEIKNLNKSYRNIDKETDVLSFHYFDDFSNCKKDETVWEIILCEYKIIVQWVEYWLWSEKELYKLIIHSILHILWFDHENDEDYEEMSKFEKLVWKEVFVE